MSIELPRVPAGLADNYLSMIAGNWSIENPTEPVSIEEYRPNIKYMLAVAIARGEQKELVNSIGYLLCDYSGSLEPYFYPYDYTQEECRVILRACLDVADADFADSIERPVKISGLSDEPIYEWRRRRSGLSQEQSDLAGS